MRDKIEIKVILIVCWLVFSYAPSWADGPGSKGGAFLRLGQGARAIGMGQAQIACSNDPSASFWNPASLIQVNNQALFMKAKYLLDIDYEYLGITKKISDSVVACAITYLSTEDTRRDENRIELGSFKNYDLSIDVAYSEILSQYFSFGMGIRNIVSKLDDKKGVAIGFNLGFLYKKKHMAAGACIQNAGLGSHIRFIRDSDPLPLQFVAGFSYALNNLLITSKASNKVLAEGKVLISADFTKPIETSPYLSLGCEYSIKDTIFIRAGLPKLNKGFFSASFGCGFKFFKKHFDMAFTPSFLGNASYFSIGFEY